MESAKLSNDELKDLILYGLRENGIDIESLHLSKIKTIISDYSMFCNHFQSAYVVGELDTFKRAACLLVAINRNRLSKDERINASIALDAAYKMCETPYWNVGENYDVPKKLEEVNFKECFKYDMYAYDKSKSMLIDSLVYENGAPLSYYLNLELFYQLALELKRKNNKNVNYKLNEKQEKQRQEKQSLINENKSLSKRKRRLFNFLKK